MVPLEAMALRLRLVNSVENTQHSTMAVAL